MFKNKQSEKQEILDLKKYIKQSLYQFNEYQTKELHDEFTSVKEKMVNQKFKGIVIYSSAVMWQPEQRPHHFLRELTKRGYLCFFCEENLNDNYIVKEMYPNLYLVNGEVNLIPLLKNKEVIFLITYFLQYLFSKQFKNPVLWFDLLDRLDFMSLYNSYSKKIYKKLIKKANLITYSSQNLKFYLGKRDDAILLPNAANIEDFKIEKTKIPEDVKEIINNSKPIIGYYGAIENWIDFDLINIIDKTNKYNIIMIGSLNKSIDLKLYNFQNVYFLGEKPFKELKYYTEVFDIGFVPFIVNDLTNSVSPVKFYEYIASGLPVASTAIYEMTKINSEVLGLINKKNAIEEIERLLKLDPKVINVLTKKIVEENTWEKRLNIIEGVLNNG